MLGFFSGLCLYSFRNYILYCSVFRVTPKTIHLIFSVYLAIEEINKDYHILPNISLLVNIECDQRIYDKKSGLGLKSKEIIPNYYCRNQRRYLIVLTIPEWTVSTSLGPFLYISRIPEVIKMD